MKLPCLAILLLLTACSTPQEPATETVPATSAPPAADPAETPPASDPAPAPPPQTTQAQTPPAAEQNIYIDAVEIANPIVVYGRARTFENNVALRVRDADGRLIVETYTTSTGEIGHHNPYRASIWLTRHPGSRVTVEALEYSAKDGSERGLVREEKAFGVEPVEARLYFPDASCSGVKPYTRRIPKSISMARLLVEALIAGPISGERGATNPFPRGSAVQSVNLRDGVLTVDFNERLRNVGGSCAAQMIRQSVTTTLRQLPSVQKVVIKAAGSEELALQP